MRSSWLVIDFHTIAGAVLHTRDSNILSSSVIQLTFSLSKRKTLTDEVSDFIDKKN